MTRRRLAPAKLVTRVALSDVQDRLADPARGMSAVRLRSTRARDDGALHTLAVSGDHAALAR